MNREQALKERLTALERVAKSDGKTIEYECPECGGGFHEFEGLGSTKKCPFCETEFGDDYNG